MPFEPTDEVEVKLQAQQWNKALEILWNQKYEAPINTMPLINAITNQVQAKLQSQQPPVMPPIEISGEQPANGQRDDQTAHHAGSDPTLRH